MRTVQTNIYKFAELSEEAKQNAINNLSDINVMCDWWWSVYADAENIGLKITSFDVDRNRYADGDLLLSASEVAQKILNNHGESCDTHKLAATYLEEFTPIFSDYMNEEGENYESRELEEIMKELEGKFLKDLLEEYSILLQHELEWLQSDEAIIETIEANEYEFTEYGKLY